MKKIYFFIASLFVFSCSNDEMANKMEEKLTDESTAIATETLIPEPEKPDTVRPGGDEKPYPSEPDGGENIVPPVPGTPRVEYIAFTGDDIKSFNITTREIVVTSLTVEEFYARVSNSTKLTFYFDGKPLFESTPIEVGLSSRIYNNLVFTCSDDIFYLSDGYPVVLDWASLSWPNKEDVRRERDENAQKRAAEWAKFVKYLRDAGKTVE